ncbi:hypothetical protein J5N97_008846 [Dioscorea zingiberensis]|uniref:Chlororespiratory reduction 4 n=1 Tax=Dioscorea zingiberensis TaxID=325984 RepID=A0A9D5CW03_9LILI|nr:hypothetical protein J5N97_008846 [Dioscorea zingiberensis]
MLLISPSLQIHGAKPIPSSPTPQQWRLSKPHPAISLLHLSKTHKELSQIHSLLVRTQLIQDHRAFARLFLAFASLSDPDSLRYAHQLFHSSHCPRTPFFYNSMIKAYSLNGDPKTALLLFCEMLLLGAVEPDLYTYTFVCNACSKSMLVFEGKQVHARLVKSPTGVSPESWNSLMDFYLKIGEDVRRVRRIFDGMKDPCVVAWNCLLDGYVKLGGIEDARKLFDEMPERDTVSWTTMLVGYVNEGMLDEACRLFDEMPEKNMVSWSVMIKGFSRLGRYKEALDLFKEMQVLDIEIDKMTLTTLLSACAGLGALDQGCWIHAFIDKHGVEVDAHLCTALVDMYAKCGRIDLACKVFQGFENKKVFLWNAMLGGFAMHSLGLEAVRLFVKMLDCGIKPNEITFICVLSACSHSGLVEDGLCIFHSMAKDYKIEPHVQHYGCMVDLLGRAGLFEEAKRVIEAMPMKANGNVWRALLGACRIHGRVELGEQVGRMLLEMEPMDDGNYVLLSNFYASENRWEDVARLRRVMKEKRVRKTPGWSSIELDGIVHMFAAGDFSHPQSRDIYPLLDELTQQFIVDNVQ